MKKIFFETILECLLYIKTKLRIFLTLATKIESFILNLYKEYEILKKLK